jgi:hypothetical protein
MIQLGEVMGYFQGCSEVLYHLFFKVIFARKYIKIIFFYFLKIIFHIGILKQYKNTKFFISKNKEALKDYIDCHRELT